MDFRSSLRRVRSYNVESADGNGGDASNAGRRLVIGASVCTLVLFALFCPAVFALGIAKLVMGGLYVYDCDVEPMLPIYLLVEGSVGFFLSCNTCGSNDSSGELQIGFCVIFRLIQAAFQIAWLIAGTVWVVNVRSIIYAPDFCKAQIATTTQAITTTLLTTTTTTTTAAVTTTAATIANSTAASIVNATAQAGPLLLRALAPAGEALASTNTVKCASCPENLVDFTFGVVIFQWVLSGLLIIGIMCCCFAKKLG